ncbi:MAG: multicopper oxidase domain-containing protein [Leptolyngbyaceae cyanobacterium MO_188.B28]|nr:multicopper oxidase domain-containing protein [Leptolyngbyaceae cyanobacterium MO_188.B28]
MNITRREALQLGLMGGGSLLLSQGFPMSASASEVLSHQIERFKQPFRPPPVLTPKRSYEGGKRPLDVYEITMQKASVQLAPDLEPTEIWGYNGVTPGPIIRQRGGFRGEDKGRSSLVRFINKLGSTIENGEEVPIETTVHLHGMASLPQYDGYAEDLTPPDHFKDYYYPNDRAATIWYHDHAIDKTARNVYMGLAGMYIVEDEEERRLNLPKGDYDVPLILQDVRLARDNSLLFNDRRQLSQYGDIILVNGVPWPYMKVARRKYRFRVLNASTSRTFQLILSQKKDGLTTQDWLHVIATDCGLMEKPVKVGLDFSSRDRPPRVLQIWPAERYEFVIDFSQYPSGSQLYLQNPALQFSGNIDSDIRVRTLMRFDIEQGGVDDSDLPDKLRDFEPLVDKIQPGEDPPIRQFVFGRGLDWTINGKTWSTERVDANPEPGAIEVWELINRGGGWIHPVHIHFADWQILDRNGRPPIAYERGWKDVFRVGHFETVRVIAEFGRRNGDYIKGKFMFHCHNLVHEDHSMMTQFEIGEGGPDPFADPPKPISEMRSL